MPRYRIEPGVVFELIEDEAVILSLDSSTYYKLNPIGTRVWQLLLQELSEEQLVETLQDEYDAELAQVRGDVHALLAELQRKALVRLIPELAGKAAD
jgi:hypothetical protein